MQTNSRLELGRRSAPVPGENQPMIDSNRESARFVALVGPAASGKSELMRRLAGCGPLEVAAYSPEPPAADSRARVRPPGYFLVPDHNGLLEDRSVLENIEQSIGRYRGLSHDVIPALAHETLEFVGFPARLQAYAPRMLGAEENKRAALARGLCSGAGVLLLEHPTVGLSATAADRIFAVLARMSARKHISILMDTHDLGALERNGIKASYVVDGRIAESGSVAALRGSRNPRVRAYVQSTTGHTPVELLDFVVA